MRNEISLRVSMSERFFSKTHFPRREFGWHRIDLVVGDLLQDFAWIETKRADCDEATMFAQLILTAKQILNKGVLPPRYLATYDTKDFAFLEFKDILPVFSLNDMNWTETPSRPSAKTIATIGRLIAGKMTTFEVQDERSIRAFIQRNHYAVDQKLPVTPSNFLHVFFKWLERVWPSIESIDLKQYGILPADFFLADLMSQENTTIFDNLKILLQSNHYQINIDLPGFDRLFRHLNFKRNDMTAHRAFWNAYERPPEEQFQKEILGRRDLLVPREIRERKGSFFTPQIWVEKAQKYIARRFGENWQDNYIVWDCCGGTGNLLNGLSNAKNIFISTLDQSDVDIIHETQPQWFQDHVFQFDFLNDDFDEKLPNRLLQAIRQTPEKIIVFINPPYAEATNSRTNRGSGQNRSGIKYSKTQEYFDKKHDCGSATRELYIQFLLRIKRDLDGCQLALFSTPKYINSKNTARFREYWKATFLDGFLVPANTFDNVTGHFPIAFCLWSIDSTSTIDTIILDIFDKRGDLKGKKTYYSYDGDRISVWFSKTKHTRGSLFLGRMAPMTPDFQGNTQVFIDKTGYKNQAVVDIHENNLIHACVYLATRQSIANDWTNNRDQFLAPLPTWEQDLAFQNDCLIFTCFHGQNKTRSLDTDGVNNWIPFTEKEVGARQSFTSSFMSEFIQKRNSCRPFSQEALAVLDAGRNIWRYYLSLKPENRNASFLEIKEFFRGRTNGRLNASGADEHFESLMDKLTDALKLLATNIAQGAYQHGFLSILRPVAISQVISTDKKQINLF